MTTKNVFTHKTDSLKELLNLKKTLVQWIEPQKHLQRITQLLKFREQIQMELVGIRTSYKSTSDLKTIPVQSLKEQVTQMRLQVALKISNWIVFNPSLQCYQLARCPTLQSKWPIHTNNKIANLISQIRPFLSELYLEMYLVKCSIRLHYPRMCDGEYIGTELLDEMIEAVELLQKLCYTALDSLMGYHSEREDQVIKVVHNVHLEDEKQQVCKLDRKYSLFLQNSINNLIFSHMILHDLLQKNSADMLAFTSVFYSENDSPQYNFYSF